MDLYSEFFSVASAFNRHKVRYAVIGGIAVAVHGYPRFTKDIDFLVDAGSVKSACRALAKCGYEETAAPWTFKTSGLTLRRYTKVEGRQYLAVDVLVDERGAHEGVLKRAQREKWRSGAVKVARREDLVTMKRVRNSTQDKADIERLESDEN